MSTANYSHDDYILVENICRSGKEFIQMTDDDKRIILRVWPIIPGIYSNDEWVRFVMRRRASGLCPYE